MSSKPETVYYRSILKLLPRGLYVEKMYNPLKGGTPDLWLSGTADDLWLEVKFVNPIPVHVPIRIYKILSPLQRKWLSDRYTEGRNTAVLLGTPKGSIIIENKDWEVLDVLAAETEWLDKQQIANHLSERLMFT
jgi:hypothetical protein